MTELHDLPITSHAFPTMYARALERHVCRPGEPTLREAYELGRTAIDLEIAVLDVATAHHTALRQLLRPLQPDEVDPFLAAAADFLAEALTASEMVRRGFLEIREAERQQRAHAAVIRRLSTLLADTSLVAHGHESIAEMLQLVVEHTRELTQAACCAARLEVRGRLDGMEAVSAGDDEPRGAPANPDLIIPLTTLDGSRLGTIELWSVNACGFSELDEAIALHLAQMASAALDRAQLHGREQSA
jgi:phosphoserine phosphatase RsbU-like protein